MAQILPRLCPAKINLMLAVTGRRPDGFHDLVSLVVPLDFGDELSAEPATHGRFELICDDPVLAAEPDNLVLRAARAFRAETGWAGGVRFNLTKRIPTGAGLGGGSSDAAQAILLMEELAGIELGVAVRFRIAAAVGSDVPLFLLDGPAVIRGRGDVVETVSEEVAHDLAGRRVVLLKPDFGVPTPWAYRELAAGAPATYCEPATAEALLAAAMRNEPSGIGYNSFEKVVFRKFLALPAFVKLAYDQFGIRVHMSGSGSCCYAWGVTEDQAASLAALARESWGQESFCRSCLVLGKR
jgi:4-diphosphocytidyl-2-C-methyl-D-erythritol kinase